MNHIVLFEPEIPQNTGNIMRTSVATNSTLHLIKPFGFSLDDKEIKRSSVNYTHNFTFYIYNSFNEFMEKNKDGVYIFLTRYGLKKHTDLDYSDPNKNYYFILGKESTGIPLEILKEHLDTSIRIPMMEDVRALNVSNACAIIIYEALRQQNFQGLSIYEPESLKGKNHILNSANEKS